MGETRGRRRSRFALAGLLTTTGAAHLVIPRAFERLVPGWVPGSPGVVNLLATAAELGSAALLLRRGTARAGGWAALFTFAVVWVANIDAAFGDGTPGVPGWLGSREAAWLRVPLQLPLLWWAWTLARTRR